jgi:hypothetical protein
VSTSAELALAALTAELSGFWSNAAALWQQAIDNHPRAGGTAAAPERARFEARRLVSMVTVIDGAFVAVFDGLPLPACCTRR